MLGHHLLTITLGAEERLLTQKFGSFTNCQSYPQAVVNRCYMQRIQPGLDGFAAYQVGRDPSRPRRPHAAFQYEILCQRFGDERINRAIRNRILTNRMWRDRKEAAQPVGRSNREAEPALQ